MKNKQIIINEINKLTEKLGELFEDDDLVLHNEKYEEKWDLIIKNFAINLLSKLHLEEGVVIAEGKVEILGWGYAKVGEEYVEDLLKKYEGKKGKLIFIEDNK